MATTFNITADSKPAYDGWGSGAYWGCMDWISWHKALVAKYGINKANAIWVDAWLSGVSTGGGGKGTAPGSNFAFDSVPVECRTFDTGFRSYIKANKVLDAAVYTGIGGLIAKPLGAGVDIIKTGSDVVSDAADSVSWTVTALKYALPVLILGIGGILLYAGIKHINKVA